MRCVKLGFDLDYLILGFHFLQNLHHQAKFDLRILTKPRPFILLELSPIFFTDSVNLIHVRSSVQFSQKRLLTQLKHHSDTLREIFLAFRIFESSKSLGGPKRAMSFHALFHTKYLHFIPKLVHRFSLHKSAQDISLALTSDISTRSVTREESFQVPYPEPTNNAEKDANASVNCDEVIRPFPGFHGVQKR